MIRFLHLSDLHLGWRPSFLEEGEAERFQKERDQLFAQAIEYALAPEHNIHLVIIAGDLFETHNPPQNIVETTISKLKSLIDNGIQVITVPGNHDEITYRDSVYRLEGSRWPGVLVTNPNPQLVGQLEVNEEPLYLYSLAYTGGITKTNPPINQFPKTEGEGFHLGVFHGSYNWDGGDRSLPLEPAGLAAANYNYVALGHFHIFATYTLGQGLAVYPGAIGGKGFHDPGVGHLLVGEWQRGKGVRLERVPISAPNFKELIVDISNVNQEEQLVELLEGYQEAEAMVRLVLQGVIGFPLEEQWLQERLEGGFRYLEIDNQSFFLSQEELEQWSQEKTITGYFLNRMGKKLAEAPSEEEKRLLNRALLQGIRALKGGE